MPQASDSNYAAVTRHRKPWTTSGRLDIIIDDDWAKDKLVNDDVLLDEPPMEEEADTVVVSRPSQEDRRRREEGWNDLGLDQILGSDATTAARQSLNNNNNNTSTTSGV